MTFPRFRQYENGLMCSVTRALAVCMVVGVVACSSPTEKANKYYESGMALLAKGTKEDLVKADVEFRNALQLEKNMTKAIYGQAQVAERQGDLARMFKLLTSVVEQDPKNLEAQLRLGRLYLLDGKLDKALEISNLTLSQDKENPEVLAFRASVMYKLDDRKAATELANAALAKDPKRVDALLVLASERIAADDPVKALEYLDKGLQANEKDVALQLFKIQALEKMSRPDLAEGVYRKLIALYPNTTLFNHELVRFYLAHRRTADAEAELRAIVAQHPDDLAAKLDVVGFVGTTRGSKAALAELRAYIQQFPKDSQLKFALASMYEAANDHQAAEQVLRDVMAHADNARDQMTAKGLLAGTLLVRGEKQAGMALVQEILSADKRNEQALILRASVEIEDRQLDQAIGDLRTVLRDVPDSPRAHLLLGRAHELTNARELAGDHFAKAFQAGKMAPTYGIAYAEYLLRVGQAAQAEKVLNGVLKTTPNHVPAIKLLAQARINQGDWVGAQKLADEARRSRADKGQLADEISGVLYANRRDFDQSVEAFKRLHAAAPDDMQPLVSLVRAYLLAGKRNDAQNFLASVLKASPDNTTARLLQGQVYSAGGETEKAAQAFQQVIAKEPRSPAGYLNLANLYAHDRRYQQADKVVREGLAVAPNDFGLRLALAGVTEMLGRYDDAIRLNEELLAKYPNSEIVANNLASLLSDRRNDEASLKRAYELAQRFQRSDVPQFKDTFGWAAYRAGKTAEAVGPLEKATALMPDVAVFHYHLGMVYASRGNKDGARRELQKSLELAKREPFPEAERAQAALNGL